MRYFIIAGEASGNNYARRLIQELKISDQQAKSNISVPMQILP
jgi:lipid A disaccharide synthetase